MGDFNQMIATALRNELGDSRRSVKTLMGWTGACERTVKNWLAGACGPSGVHLVELARHSDEVFDLLLVASGRRPVLTTLTLARLRAHLADTIARLDRHLL